MLRIRHLAAPMCALPLAALLAATSAAAAATLTASALPATAPVDFEVFLPLRNKSALQTLLTAQQTVGSPSYHRWLTPAQFAAQFGPTPASFAHVAGALQAAGLTITETHTRSLHVAGSAAAVGAAFHTQLAATTLASGAMHIATASPITAPDALKAEGATIVAFSGVQPRHVMSVQVPLADPDNRNGKAGAYNYNDLKQAYDYPAYGSVLPNGKPLDGTGVNVAILMETTALNSDVAAMFNHENFTTTTGLQPPTFTTLNVDGGAPFNPNSGGSFEASLDVQQVLGGAPGANVTLVSIPDLYDSHILDGYVTIVDKNKWDIVSSSFGGCELGYLPAYNAGVDETGVLIVEDELFAQGNAQGITFLASSGDEGGLECPQVSYFYGASNAKFVVSVSTPADDPNVTAVGGGNLITTPPNLPSLTSAYVSENADGDPEVPYDIYGFGHNVSGGYWGAGGGFSVIFGRPVYQNTLNPGIGRLMPDVGMLVGGCPGGLLKGPCPANRSAAIVTLAGHRYGVIGTSVASPEFAGALALAEEVDGTRVGNLNPFLWGMGYSQDDLGGAKAAKIAQLFHKNIPGFDGAYHQKASDPVGLIDGNGTPDVRKLFGLTMFPAAGDPRTPSNP